MENTKTISKAFKTVISTFNLGDRIFIGERVGDSEPTDEEIKTIVDYYWDKAIGCVLEIKIEKVYYAHVGGKIKLN